MANLKLNKATYYDVYWVESAGMLSNHVAIFTETHELGPGTGHNFQVSGNIQQGMYHNHRPGMKPEEDEQSAFISRTFLGRVSSTDYDSGKFRQICDQIEPPLKQFEGPKRLFPGKKLRKCGEWAEDATKTLRQESVLAQPEFYFEERTKSE